MKLKWLIILIGLGSCNAADDNKIVDYDASLSIEKVRSWIINAPKIIPTPLHFSVLNDSSIVITDIMYFLPVSFFRGPKFLYFSSGYKLSYFSG